MSIHPDEFLDGGIGNNNPSSIAWNEAKWMSNCNDPHDGRVAALVSLGSGEKEEMDLFGNQKSLYYLYKIMRYGKNEISNTARAHNETHNLADTSGSRYFRFSVPPIEGDNGHDGLASIRLVECVKEPKKSWAKWTKEKAAVVGSSIVRAARVVGRSGTRPSTQAEEWPARPEWYTTLQAEAETPEGQQGSAGQFKPRKYVYATYDKIFDRTSEYCTGDDDDLQRRLDACATELLRCARERRNNDFERWKRFVSHPHPNHRRHLPRILDEPPDEHDEE